MVGCDKLGLELTAMTDDNGNYSFTNLSGGKDWLFGDWSVADGYIFVFFNWATKLGLDVSAYPNYAKHFERMQKRPAVQRALAREAEAMAAMDKAA